MPFQRATTPVTTVVAVFAVAATISLFPGGLTLGAPSPLSEAEPLVLSFRQGRFMVIDAVLGYRAADGELFLPLEEISAGLGLAIAVDKVNRTAHGYYLSEKNSFHLDLNSGIVDSSERSFTIETNMVIEHALDMYVSLTGLNVWFRNMHFEFHRNDMYIEVSSDPPLPMVERQLRNQTRPNVGARHSGQQQLDLPEVVAAYEAIRSPVIDVNAVGSWSQRNSAWTATTVRGAQDFLGLGTYWFANFDRDNKLRDTRIVLSRKDPDGGLLGPFHLTEIEAGDVVQRWFALTSGGLRGLGLRATSRPRDVSSGSTTDLRGELPHGWEAELYHNNVLIAQTETPQNGQYVFADLPLHAGVNELTVVLYGPQGQREEHRETIRLNGAQPATGRWYFDGSVLFQDVTTLPVEEWLYSEDRGVYGDKRDVGEAAVQSRVVCGISPGVSLALTGASMSLHGQRRGFAGVSTGLSVQNADIEVNSVIDHARQLAASVRLTTRLLGVGSVLQYETFEKGYHSPANTERWSAEARTTRHRTEVRLNRRFDTPSLPISSIFRGLYQRFVAANSEMRFESNTSLSLGSAQLNNEVEGVATEDSRWALADLRGGVGVSWRHRVGQVRSGFVYTAKPHWHVAAVAFTSDGAVWDDMARFSLSVSHQFDSGTFVDIGLGWKLPQVELMGGLSHNTSTGELVVNAGMRCSMGWTDGGALPHIGHQPMTSRSFARAHVFLDRDGDGAFSIGDEPQPGVQFKPSRQGEKTDANGLATVSGLSELRPTDVVLDQESLPDIFLRSTFPGYRVAVRPGAPVRLVFPVVWVSDIEGTVVVTQKEAAPQRASTEATERGLGNVQVLVLDEDEQEIRRVRSEFDGFFAVTGLPSGRYTLRMDPQQAARFGIDDEGGVQVRLHDETAILAGVKLRLKAGKLATE